MYPVLTFPIPVRITLHRSSIRTGLPEAVDKAEVIDSPEYAGRFPPQEDAHVEDNGVVMSLLVEALSGDKRGL